MMRDGLKMLRELAAIRHLHRRLKTIAAPAHVKRPHP